MIRTVNGNRQFRKTIVIAFSRCTDVDAIQTFIMPPLLRIRFIFMIQIAF